MILTEKLVQNLSTVSSEAKVAYVLLFLADKYGVKDSEGIGFELPMNREDLANYAGVTRETMSRKLGLLTKEGIISTIGNKIILVKDYEALAHLAGV